MKKHNWIVGMAVLILLPAITVGIMKLPDIFYQKMDEKMESKVMEKQYSFAKSREPMTLKQTIDAFNSKDAVLLEESFAVSTQEDLKKEVSLLLEELTILFPEELKAYFEGILLYSDCLFGGFSFQFLQVADGGIYCGNAYVLFFQSAIWNVRGGVLVDANSGKILTLYYYHTWWDVNYDSFYYEAEWEEEAFMEQLESYYEGAFQEWNETQIYMDMAQVLFGVIKEDYIQLGIMADVAEWWDRNPADYVRLEEITEAVTENTTESVIPSKVLDELPSILGAEKYEEFLRMPVGMFAVEEACMWDNRLANLYGAETSSNIALYTILAIEDGEIYILFWDETGKRSGLYSNVEGEPEWPLYAIQ